jgi:hypothetical protein
MPTAPIGERGSCMAGDGVICTVRTGAGPGLRGGVGATYGAGLLRARIVGVLLVADVADVGMKSLNEMRSSEPEPEVEVELRSESRTGMLA